ncbi:ABC-type transport auxiliary lipoprotein family protein [Rhizobium sp. C1]|uniref:ABC-type transport auxiliary lipoprotein family protein n=1 Tax=Rhizobium sp. C1 TaxID=1349799 RepID=UPI001E32F88A|nr:ABC-type transport auxiliary lipoprotein family protein [Rhizobium sp. C1]MCD2177268.1 ABC-type transport auxiliary lipoprotein family protein [Rhizobium sp. C1]
MMAATLALSACATSAPKDLFGLSAVSSAPGPVRKGRQVLIANPVATQMLDSQNVVVRVSGQEYQFLGDSQWSDRLPKLVQLKLAQAFQNSGKVGGAGLPGEGLAIDEQIQTTINTFEISASENMAVVDITARLLNDRNGQVRASKNFRAAVPVSGSGNKAYIAALNAAFGQVSGALVAWALGTM